MLRENGIDHAEDESWQTESEFKMPEPVFRSSEGKLVTPFSRKETSQQDGQKEKDQEILSKTLLDLESAESVRQAHTIIENYNNTRSPIDMGVRLHTNLVKKIRIDGKPYNLFQSIGPEANLLLFPDSSPDFKVERTSMEQIWSKLQQDPVMLQILGYMTTGRMFMPQQAREQLTFEHVKQFYKEFPTEDLYMQNERIGMMLSRLKRPDKKHTYNNYHNKAAEFVDLMYPED